MEPTHQPQAESPQQDYEFNALQNETIRVLASRMKLVGLFYIVIGGFFGLIGFMVLFFLPPVGLIYMLLAAPYLMIGIWTNNASTSFRLIVETRGYDINHLMSALESLRKLYTLQFWMLIISIIVVVLVIIIGLLIGLNTLMPTGQQTSFTLQ